MASQETHMTAVIGNPSNFWLYSTREDFDLTHPSTPAAMEVEPRLTLKTSTSPITLSPTRTALVIIDMQNYFLSPSFGRSKGTGHIAMDNLLENAIPAARKAGIRIVWLNWGLTDEDVKEMPPAVKRAFGFEAVAGHVEEPANGLKNVDSFSERAEGVGVDKHGNMRSQSSHTLQEKGRNARTYKGLGSPCGDVTLPEGKTVDAGRQLVRGSWNAALYPPLDAAFEEGEKLANVPDVWIHKNR